MRKFLVATAMVMASASLAHAEGELFLYNWGNYTSPDMIKNDQELALSEGEELVASDGASGASTVQ